MNVVIYARQSLDRTGESLAVTRQLELCREFAAERGWTVTREYVDNDLSATTGVKRPAFEQVLASGAKHVVVWHIDRLLRLTRDLERVIDAGANVYAVKAGHIDLSNPAGRAVARTITAWATYEGEQKAERQKASNDQRARAGRPSAGRRCYGYTADGMTVVEEEAVHVRRAVAAVLDGTPLRSVVRQMNEAGARSTAGNPWTPTELRRYLMRPRLAGQRVHRGEVVGKGQWTPILTEDEHVSVSAILSDPSRRPKGRPRAYLLSGVGRCGVCGGRLYGRIEKRGPIYTCESGAHLGRKIADIDAFVEAVVVERLSRPDARDLFTVDDTDQVADLQRERSGLLARLDELAESFAEGEITRRQMTTASAKMNTRVEEIDAALPSLSTGPLSRLLGRDDVEAEWDSLDVETRREIIAALLEVTVHRAGRGARVFDPETVTIEWRTS